MYKHIKQFVEAGFPLGDAKKAIIMLHGRGASAESILSLGNHLAIPDTFLIAPKATNNSWYPFSFMAPDERNQPALASALEVIDDLVKYLLENGIRQENIYFLGFSQGACLSLEYAARNAAKYGGVIAFTGGLIGENLVPDHYSGNFENTPILITTGDPDDHVPLFRVEESVDILKKLQGNVSLKVYKGRLHTIQPEEIKLANELILK